MYVYWWAVSVSLKRRNSKQILKSLIWFMIYVVNKGWTGSVIFLGKPPLGSVGKERRWASTSPVILICYPNGCSRSFTENLGKPPSQFNLPSSSQHLLLVSLMAAKVHIQEIFANIMTAQKNTFQTIITVVNHLKSNYVRHWRNDADVSVGLRIWKMRFHKTENKQVRKCLYWSYCL